MKKLEFTVKVEGRGTSVSWLNPPFEVVEVFGTRARVPVRGTINGFPFRSSLMPMGGCHGMPINQALRKGAGVEDGDTISVVMERDDAERTVEVTPILKKELGEEQDGAGELGRAFVYQSERDRAFDQWSQAGRDSRATAGEGDGYFEDWQEMDWLGFQESH